MENDLKISRSENDVTIQRSNDGATEWMSSVVSMESLSQNDVKGSHDDSEFTSIHHSAKNNRICDGISKTDDVTSAGNVSVEKTIAVNPCRSFINGKELGRACNVNDYDKLANHCESDSSTFNASINSFCELFEKTTSSDVLSLSSSPFPSSLPSCVPSTIIILSTNGLSESPSTSCHRPISPPASVTSLTTTSQIYVPSVALLSECLRDENELQSVPTSTLLPTKLLALSSSSLAESQPEVASSIAVLPSLSPQYGPSFLQSSSSSILLPNIQPSLVLSESTQQQVSPSILPIHSTSSSHPSPLVETPSSELPTSLPSQVSSSSVLLSPSSTQLSSAASTCDKISTSSSSGAAAALEHESQPLSSAEGTSKHSAEPSLSSVLSPPKPASPPQPAMPKQNRRFPIKSPPQQPRGVNLYDFSPSKESPLKPLRPPKRQSPRPLSAIRNQSSYLSRYRANNLRRAVLEKSLLEKSSSDRVESTKVIAVCSDDKSVKASDMSAVKNPILQATSDTLTVKSQIVQATSNSILLRNHDKHKQQQKQTSTVSAGSVKPPRTKTSYMEKAKLEHSSRRADTSDDDFVPDEKPKRGRPKKRGRGRPPKVVVMDSSRTSSLETLRSNKSEPAVKSENVHPKRTYKKRVRDTSPDKRTTSSPVLTRSSRKKPRPCTWDCSLPSIAAQPPATTMPFVGLVDQQANCAKPRNVSEEKCAVVVQGGFLESKKFLRNYIQFSCNEDILFPHITHEDVCFFKLANQFYKEHKDKAYDIFGQEDEEINNLPSGSNFSKSDNTNVSVRLKTPTVSKPTTQVRPFSFSAANEVRSASPKSKNRNSKSGSTAGDALIKKGKERPKKRLISSILRELGDHDNSNRLTGNEESKMEVIDSSFEEGHNNLSTSVIDGNDTLTSPPTDAVTPNRQRSFVTFVTPQKRPRMEDNGSSGEGGSAKRQCFEDRPSLFLSFGSTSCSPEEKFYSFESLAKHSGHPNSSKSGASVSSSATVVVPKPSANVGEKQASSFVEIRKNTKSVETLTDESGLSTTQPRCSCMHQCGLQNTYLSAPLRRPTPNDLSGSVPSRPNSGANQLLAVNYPALLQPNLYPGPFLGQGGPFLLSLPSGDFHQLPVDFREQQPPVIKNSLHQHSPLYRNDGQSSIIPFVVAAPNGYYAVPIATDMSDKPRISNNFGPIIVPYIANDGTGSFQVPTYLTNESASSIQVSTDGSSAPPDQGIAEDVPRSDSETNLLTTTVGPSSSVDQVVLTSSSSISRPQPSFVEMLQESIPVGVVNDTLLDGAGSMSSRSKDEANIDEAKSNINDNNTLNSSHFSAEASNCDNTSIMSSSSTYFLSEAANEQSYQDRSVNHSLIGHFNNVSTIDVSTNSISSVNSTSYFPVVSHSVFNHQQSHASSRNTNYVHYNYGNCMPPPTFAPQRPRYVPPESYPRQQQAFTNLDQQVMPSNSTIVGNYAMLTPKHQQHHYGEIQQSLPQHFNYSSLYPGSIGSDFRGSASYPRFFFDGRGKPLPEGFGGPAGSFLSRNHQNSRGGIMRSTTPHEHDASNLWN